MFIMMIRLYFGKQRERDLLPVQLDHQEASPNEELSYSIEY